MIQLKLSPTERATHTRPSWRAAIQSSFQSLALLGLLTLLLLGLGARFANRHTHLALGSGADARMLVFFGLPEQSATDTFRWTQPLARVFLYGLDGRTAALELRLVSPRPPDAPAATLAPEVQGQRFGPFAVTGTFRRYRLLVPSSPTRETVVALNGSVFQPVGGDQRTLGVAVSDVRVQAVGSALAAWRRWAVLLTLPLLAWLLVGRLGAGAGWRLIIGLGATAVAGAAALFPGAAGFWLPLIWWPWWPLMPLLGLAAAPAVLRWLPGRVPFAPWAGLLLAVVGLVGVRLNSLDWLWMSVALAGALLALANVDLPTPAPCVMPLRWEVLAVVGLTALALGLRLSHLDTLPLGLWRDEARHGLVALRIWNDPNFRPVYVVNRADLPALLFYLMAPIVGIFGPQVWSARLVSAVAGGLAPLALWWAVRPMLGRRAALLGAALLAWASWSLSMSRWAFPTTLDQLLTLLAVGAAWRALGAQRRSGLVAGLAASALLAGLAAYTYHTGRFTPLIVAALTAMWLGWSGMAWRRAAPGLLAALLVSVLTLLPLASFVIGNYEGFSRRVELVALLNSDDLELRSPVSLVARNAGYYLLMWHVSGEWNGRHHAPWAPMLDPLAGALLLLGVGLALRSWRSIYGALLVWLALALLPGLFSTDAPHAMRSFGALAPALALAGAGFAALLRRRGQVPVAQRNRRARLPLTALVLTASLAFNLWLYFARTPHDPRVVNEFEPSLTAMARVARVPFATSDPTLRAVQVFLPARVLMQDPVRFLCADLPIGLFDGVDLVGQTRAAALVLLPPDAPSEQQQAALTALGPGGRALHNIPTSPGGQPLFQAYGVGVTNEQFMALAQAAWR